MLLELKAAFTYIFTRQNDLRMPLVIRENEITAIRQVKKEIVVEEVKPKKEKKKE